MSETNAKPFMQFNALTMRCYNAQDIKKLSVRQLDQTKTFDEAGFPINGGLYDKALGPSGLQDICSTCGLRGLHCPGHYGHIELSVPVFNSLFYSVTLKLMKATCLHCHRFTCNTGGDTVLQFIRDWAALSTDQIKNTVAERHEKLKDFFRETLFKRKTKCPHCHRSNGVVRNDAGRAFILDFTGGGGASSAGGRRSRKAATTARHHIGDSILQETEEDAGEEVKPDHKSLDSIDFSNGTIDPLALSTRLLQKQLDSVISGQCSKLIWRAAEVREHFRLLWKNERPILKCCFPIFEECPDDKSLCPTDILFCQTVLVQPTKFRPARYLRGESFEHAITANYRDLMEADQLLTIVKLIMGGKSITPDAQSLIQSKIVGKTLTEKLHNAYLTLQQRVNCLYDQEADKMSTQQRPGLKQIIEKKEGIFRMNMMGKRVNYACRSVITPDPYLDVDEIGIPEIFARTLTFPEPINFINRARIRESVSRGQNVHPGANFIQMPHGGQRQAVPDKRGERVTLSHRLVPAGGATTNAVNATPAVVYRHLQRGDRLLMNRQPSLHKPSIMGHKARILTGQKALRMNYAPCKAYNADFDGDEMNGHLLQNLVAQSEAGELASVGNNYLVPKDGTPILGLIQDHVVSGVLLTLRDRFITKTEFMQLIFSAFAETTKRINIPPPTMLRPVVRWTGKQVITTILLNVIPDEKPKINLFGKAKTALSNWKVPNVDSNLSFEMSESEVIFREGELLCGVLDKEHYGATQYGLIHCCYELYGSKVSTKIMSCFSRLFTTFLQRHGFTLGVADILVNAQANKVRRRTIRELRKVGPDVARKTFNLPESAPPTQIRRMLAMAYNNPRRDYSDVKQLDFTMKQVMAKLCEQINNTCVPKGLIRSFPENALQLMIQSGAKGSMVNSIQISCALGQIELEGQRPPLTAVGRTLPSFGCFDPSPRAGGFVDQRFLTGLKPQELFFHTMAGREGLVDTAVKTSRSGYLQRCLIKHLEGLAIRYDNTVRDHDGSVVQFRYGEDGLDVGRATFLQPRQFRFLEQNVAAVEGQVVPVTARYGDGSEWNVRRTEKHFKRVSKWKKGLQQTAKPATDGGKPNAKPRRLFNSAFHQYCEYAIEQRPDRKWTKEKLVKGWFGLSEAERQEFVNQTIVYMDSVDVKFHPAVSLGALPEKMLEQLADYIRANDVGGEFRRVMFWKGLHAYAEPGENVGLLAAQSIGEPSTQMTLNTFHFAGRGEMNVTLGIPRLREILMTAGKNISTPMTEIHVFNSVSTETIDRLKRDLNPVGLKALIKRFTLEEEITNIEGRLWRVYRLTVELLRVKHRELAARHVPYRKAIAEIEARLLREIAHGIGKRFHEVMEHQHIQHKRLRAIAQIAGASNPDGGPFKIENDDGGGSEEKTDPKEPRDEGESTDDDEGYEGAADEVRLKKRHMDDAVDYEGEEVEQDEVGDRDDEAMDDDDVVAADDDAIARQKRRRAAAENLQPDEEEEEEEDEEMQDEQKEKLDSEIEHIPKTRLRAADRAAQAAMDNDRVADVLRAHPLIVDYRYDCSNERWCEVKFQVPLKNKTKIDVMTIVEKAIGKFVVSQVPGIQKVIVREDTRNGKTMRILQVQGINVEAIFKRSDVLDVNTLYSNDINFMLSKYGVEACGRTIEKEMNNVFGVYGIEVNPRHLSLTADYMTFTGEVLPFSRGAMSTNASPLQKMTFETTANFLRDTIITGQRDNLSSPSARLITGQLHRNGTGAFDLLADPHYVVKEESV